MTTTTEQLRDDLSRKIAACDSRLLSIFTGHVGLCKFRDEVEARAVTELLWQSVQGIVPPACAIGTANKFGIFFQHSAKDVTRLASVLAGIAAIENTPDFAEAMALISPMVAERDLLDALSVSERKAHVAAVGAAEEAHRLAMDKAKLAAENDPQVITTRARLAELENPPPLVRGRVKLPSEATA